MASSTATVTIRIDEEQMDEIRALASVTSAVVLKPGDSVLVAWPGPVLAEKVAIAKGVLEERFPGVTFTITTDGMQVLAVQPAS